jgi:hypothetical protein
MAASVAMLIAISVVFLPSLMASPGRSLRTAAWICAIYSVLVLASFYATWLTAWCVLGHPPRPSIDDPKSISPIVDVPFVATDLLIGGVPFVLLLFVPLALTATEVTRNPSARENQPLKEAVQRVAAPISWGVFFWLAVFVILLLDPLGVIFWFMD